MHAKVNVVQNLQQVRKNIAAACRRVGRNPQEVGLVAVTKSVDPERMNQALAAGVDVFGESRVQELVSKQPEFPGVRWHFIGYLQRNKVKYLPGRVELVHSLNRWSLARELDRRAREHGQVFRVLVQVNITRERGRFGVMPGEVAEFIRETAGLQGLQVEGLMTMAPFVADPEQVRPLFREMRDLFTRLGREPGIRMWYLSMGMSNDYPVAVEEGANLVRVGTAIFGPRKCTLRGG
jgi:hypothetical protein